MSVMAGALHFGEWAEELAPRRRWSPREPVRGEFFRLLSRDGKELLDVVWVSAVRRSQRQHYCVRCRDVIMSGDSCGRDFGHYDDASQRWTCNYVCLQCVRQAGGRVVERPFWWRK